MADFSSSKYRSSVEYEEEYEKAYHNCPAGPSLPGDVPDDA